MDLREIIDSLNIYSMFQFYDGRNEPGLLVSRFNQRTGSEEYRFVPQDHMQSYKDAFERFDREACDRVSEKVEPEDLVSIRAVTFSDFKRAVGKTLNAVFGTGSA